MPTFHCGTGLQSPASELLPRPRMTNETTSPRAFSALEKIFPPRTGLFVRYCVTGVVLLLRMLSPHVSAPLAVVALCSTVVASAATTVTAPAEKRAFNLPRGDAATTLKQFAADAGTPIVYLVDRVRGATTNPVNGRFAPSEALDRMLAGTALEAAQDPATGALVVSRRRAAGEEPARKNESAPLSAPQPKPNNMSPKSRSLLAVFAALIGGEAFAQTTPATTPPPQEGIVVLSPFSVADSRSSRYQPTQSVSSGRIATAIIDTAQSVSVIPRELIDDAGTSRIFDALKYVSGVSESTLPGAIDRITLRGFQTDNGLIDNFNFGLQANMDPIVIDRVEVVKGPSSILSPTGAAGGTINLVSKSPLFRRANSVKLQLGQYDANRIEADLTGPLSEGSKLAYRMLFAYEDSESYHDNTFTKSTVIMPMLAWRISPTSEFTVKYLYMDWKRPPYLGFPVEPTSNSDNEAKLLAGIPRTRSLQEEEQFRFDKRHQLFTNLELKLSDDFSGRLAVNGAFGKGGNQQLLNSGNTFGNRDPLTGKWVTGVSFLQVAPFTSSPLPAPSRMYARSGRVERNWVSSFNLQNIYALTKANDVFNSTTVFGWSIDYQNNEAKNSDSPIAPINIDTPVYGAVPVVAPANFRQRITSTTGNAFLAEQLRFLKDRLFVSGSFTALGTKTDVNNILLTPATTISNREGSKNILAWSVLGKVTTDLGVYYSVSSNAAPTSLLGTPATAFTFREGKQKEFGAKYSFNKGRSVISAAVFDISVNNFSFANPAAVGSSDPRIPLSIVGDFVSKGWELEFSSAIGTQWTLLGNYSHSKYRDTYGVRQRGTADDSAALFVRYDLGRVRGKGGLYFTAGFEYLGDRAGDAPGGFTAASTPTKIILNQPTFYVGSRKLLNLGAGYKRDRWQVDVYLQNALNEEYISATINRNLAIAGAPTNIKASFVYRF